jgi:hypothetical protein
MQFNTSYLNKTPSKTARTATSFKPEFVVMHETAGYGTLEWNLRPEVRASFNYLIVRNGFIYHYVNEREYIAWHAGINTRWKINSRLYEGSEHNTYAIGVELEGPNDGTPITGAQRDSTIKLMQYFNQAYKIPLQAVYFPEHYQVVAAVNPTYKSDAKGYNASLLVELARQSNDESRYISPLGYVVSPEFRKAWIDSGGEWRGTSLYAVGWPTENASLHNGVLHQMFERGACRLRTDATIDWLHHSEIIQWHNERLQQMQEL